MFFSILNNDADISIKIVLLMISIISLLPALTVHEWAHGFAAYKLGDSTAKADGRLSLNPLDHLDPIGALMMLFVGFGWAKPVPVNTRYFKKPKRDFAIVSLAGPIANFVLAFIFAFLCVIASYVFYTTGLINNTTADVVMAIFEYSLLMNLGLGTFNLIPLPPLDGSNVVVCLLPNHLGAKFSKLRYYSHYIFIGLILLSYMPFPFSLIYDIAFMPLNFIRNGLWDLFITIADTIVRPIFLFFLN